MQRKAPSNEITSQHIMAAILQNLPEESGLTKIEYEGPRIALYSKNPSYLMQNTQLVSNIVNTIKKRIIVRTDESIRKSEEK
jgi:predicted metal-dependent RNase